MAKETIIAEIEKSKIIKIIIKDSEFKKIRRIDIREHYYSESEKEFKPSKKGVQITYDQLEDFILPLYNYYKEIMELSKIKDGNEILNKIINE